MAGVRLPICPRGYGPAVARSTKRGRLTVGCSGWNYGDWRGLVYPADLPADQWLKRYATWFDSVELNTTFYRLPDPKTFCSWAEQVPGHFEFAVKLGAFGSHRKKLRDPTSWLPNHVDRVRLLGPHLGPNLVQLPPRWRRNSQRLDEFLEATPKDIRWAVEVRDPSWLHEDTFDVLRRHGAALCIHDLLPDHPTDLTTDWAYVRFHGPDAVHHPYRGRYGRRRLADRAAAIAGWLADGQDVYCYFNNDYDGNAVVDAHCLAALVAGD